VAPAGRVGRRGSGPAFPPGMQTAETLRARLTADPFATPEQPELAVLGLAPPVLAAAAKAGLLLRLASGVVLLPEAKAEAVCRLRALAQPFTLSQARQVLGTTRRVAVPLLEHLDAVGQTRRLDGVSRSIVE
jgi:selenocysteine-specific elongation factor